MKRQHRDTVDRRLKWTSWSCVAAGLAIGLAVLLGRGISSERPSDAPDVPLTAASLSTPAPDQPATPRTVSVAAADEPREEEHHSPQRGPFPPKPPNKRVNPFRNPRR